VYLESNFISLSSYQTANPKSLDPITLILLFVSLSLLIAQSHLNRERPLR
jgi:hypothetical protein